MTMCMWGDIMCRGVVFSPAKGGTFVGRIGEALEAVVGRKQNRANFLTREGVYVESVKVFRLGGMSAESVHV